MDILDVMKSFHSVRQYKDKKIETEKRDILNELASACNSKGGFYSKIDFGIAKYHFKSVFGNKVN